MKKAIFLIFCFIANNLFSQFLTENYSNLNNWNSTNANPNVHGVNGGVLRWNASYNGNNGANAISAFNQNARIVRNLNNNLINQKNITLELDFFINNFAINNEAGIVLFSLTTNNNHFYGLGNGSHAPVTAARSCTQNEGITLSLSSQFCNISLKRNAPSVPAIGNGDPCAANSRNILYNFSNRLTQSTWYYVRFNKNDQNYRIQIFSDSLKTISVLDEFFCDTTNFDSLNFIQQGNHPLAGGGNSNNPATFMDQDRIRMSMDNLRIWNTSVSLNPLPQISIDATLNKICIGNSSTLTANPANMTYFWLNPSNQNTRSASVGQPGIYSVIVSKSGCSDTASITIAKDTVNVLITSSSDTVCEGDSIILTASPTGMSYVWNTTPAQTSSNIVVTDSKNYNVTVTDSKGCSGIATKSVVFQNCCPQECYWTLNGNNNVIAKNFIGSKNNADFKIRTNNIERAIVKADGKIGVGTSTPTEQLHTTQGVRFEGLIKLDSPKRVIVQDLSGKLFWSDANSFKGSKGDKGDKGDTGPQGPKGDQGPVGPTPVISNLLDFTNPNKITSTVNGVSSSTITVSSVSNTSRGNQLNTSVNGVVGSTVNIINSNALSFSGSTLTSTVNGVVSNSITLPSATGSFWSLGGNNTNITSMNNIIGITNANTNPLRFFTNNSEKMTITSNGNVGIGTGINSISSKLEVNSGTVNSNNLISEFSANTSNGLNAGIKISNTNPSSNSIISLGQTRADLNTPFWIRRYGNSVTSNASGIEFWNSENSFLKFATNNTERIIILGNGNVGIGTTSPYNKLEITHGTANNSGLRFTNLTNSSSSIVNATNKVLSVNATGDVILVDDKQGTGNTTNSCNVSGSIPRLNGPNSYTCSQVFDNGTSVGVGVSSGFTYSSYSGATIGSNVPLSSGNVKLEVNGVLRSTMSIVTSDGKLKTDVKDLKEALSIVKSLKGKTYNWSSEFQKKTGVDNGRHIGFIAQEIREVLPELVIEDENKQLGVNYTELIPVLVEAIKEQQNQIDAFKSGNKVSNIAPSSNVDFDAMNKEMNQLKSENQMFKEKFELLEKSISLLCESGCAGLEKAKQNVEDIDALYQSIPNPTDNEALINYYLSKKYNNVSIQINSLEGKNMETIMLDGAQGKGSVKIQLGHYAAQTYFYSLIVDNKVVDTKKLTVIR